MPADARKQVVAAWRAIEEKLKAQGNRDQEALAGMTALAIGPKLRARLAAMTPTSGQRQPGSRTAPGTGPTRWPHPRPREPGVWCR
jgi:hypothetical protein